MRNLILLIAALLLALTAKPQGDARTLFTIGEDRVTVRDFVYVYNKSGNSSDYSEKSLRDYLNLYENFELKVKEAEALRFDTINSIKTELEGYRKQLVKSFLTDKVMLDKLIKEAYERSQKEINASHILVKCDARALPLDTMLAYKKIMALKRRLDAGESFERLAKESSEDPSAKTNEGNIGWFTVFGTVYPFEISAYTLRTGEISRMPVRTEFGYHLIKVNQIRQARGQIHVAHILIRMPENADYLKKDSVQRRVDEVYSLISKGSLTFEDAAKTYSNDKSSAGKGGELQWFGSGTSIRMVPEFEDAAFVLNRDGEVSEPVSTQFGWHIIKRLEKKSLPSFEQGKAEIKKRVERDSRLAIAKISMPQGVDENNLEQSNEEFKLLMKEYRDGIYLFELMDRRIWTKAVKDKEGRYGFYLERKSKYANGYSKDSAVIVSDYQEYLEKEWLIQLRKKYPVVVDEKVFSSFINNPQVFAFSNSAKEGKLPSQPEIKTFPAVLEVKNIEFTDTDGNNRIDAREVCYVSFDVSNTGKGPATGLRTSIKTEGVLGLSAGSVASVDVAANSVKAFKIPLNSNVDLTSGTALISVSFIEARGFVPDPFELKIATKEFLKPQVKVVDFSFLSDIGKIKPGAPVQLKCMVQNVGQGNAEDVTVQFGLPENVYPNSEQQFTLGTMPAGKAKEVVFEFLPNKLYKQSSIPINVKVTESYGKYGHNETCSAQIDEVTKGTTITVSSNAKDVEHEIQVASLSSDVDKNIPVNTSVNEHRYALIIGNEDYTRYQTSLGSESNVAFAAADAGIFAAYCEKTLGVKKENLYLLQNAIGSRMKQEIDKLAKVIQYENGNAEVIVYYAGHGFPDETTKESYIMPVDIAGSNVTEGIKLSDLYRKLTQYPVKRVTVFLDACFSGGGRDAGLLAARAVKIQPKANAISGNLVVLSASSGDQSSLPYKDKQHGMFTYFLLKKLQDSKADVLYKDLYDYVKYNVEINSIKINSKDQNPQMNVSQTIEPGWVSWKVR